MTQSQQSLRDQLIELYVLANKNGLYDAADHVRRITEMNTPTNLFNACQQMSKEIAVLKEVYKHAKHYLKNHIDPNRYALNSKVEDADEFYVRQESETRKL